jgi:hypothetical protein
MALFRNFADPKSGLRMKYLSLLLLAISLSLPLKAERLDKLRYGDFEQWVTRKICESRIIGGQTKTIYEIAPTTTITNNSAYSNRGGSQWATSNVMAHVMGITKTSNAVFPDTRESGGKCCKMTTLMEHCKAVGVINIDVVVAGSIFLGEMLEPITSTSDPYAKMEMGIPFTGRPKSLTFDYKVTIPNSGERVYSSGFGSKKTYKGSDTAEAYIILQHRTEDAKGNIHAKRVATGRERYSKSTSGWVNGHQLKLHYGDITGESFYKSYMGLIPESKCYYARNSKGKMVPVHEDGWASADTTPTHMLVMFSAGSGEAYIGTLGLTLWVDNVALQY